MSRSRITNLFAGVLMAGAGILTAGAAQAESEFDHRLALSFAPQEESVDDRFSDFQLGEPHGSYEDAHELNDAWLGMPVRDAAGKVVGYVDDAFLDEEGYLTELLVSLNGSSVTVVIDQQHVKYTEVGVLVDLPVQAIAGLQRVGG